MLGSHSRMPNQAFLRLIHSGTEMREVAAQLRELAEHLERNVPPEVDDLKNQLLLMKNERDRAQYELTRCNGRFEQLLRVEVAYESTKVRNEHSIERAKRRLALGASYSIENDLRDPRIPSATLFDIDTTTFPTNFSVLTPAEQSQVQFSTFLTPGELYETMEVFKRVFAPFFPKEFLETRQSLLISEMYRLREDFLRRA